MFYKVVSSTSLDASKRCLTNGFLMFRKCTKRIQLLVKNVMAFSYSRAHFAKIAPEVSLNEMFYKVFYQLFRLLQNTVLLKVFAVLQHRKTHSTFTGKPNAFLILFGSILQKGLQKSP